MYLMLNVQPWPRHDQTKTPKQKFRAALSDQHQVGSGINQGLQKKIMDLSHFYCVTIIDILYNSWTAHSHKKIEAN